MKNDQPTTSESARKSFDSSRRASSGVAKTAALWAAALAITWLTGLEPTLHTVKQASHTFTEINSAKQYADFRITTRKRQLENETQELEALKDFERNNPVVNKRTQKLRDLENAYKSDDKRGNQDAYSEAKSIHDEFKANMDKLNRMSLQSRIEARAKLAKSIEEEAKDLQTVRLAAKDKAEKQDRNIGFELLGVNFKVPAPIAPLLWCLFCVGLLGFVSNARRESIRHSNQGILELANLPDFSGRKIADVSGRLPTWTIRPSLAVFASLTNFEKGNDYGTLVSDAWVEQVFGSRDEHLTSDALILLLPLILLSALARVYWISLDLLRNIGPTWVRALLPVALLLNLVLMVIVSRSWLLADQFTAIRFKERGVIASIYFAGVISIPLLLFNLSLSIRLGDLLQRSLWWITLIISVMYVSSFMVIVNPGAKAALGPIHSIKNLSISRRRFISAVALIGIGIHLFSHQPRRVTSVNKHTLPIPIPPGFYQAKIIKVSDETPSVKFSKAVTSKSASRIPVLHYIGKNRRYSKRWGFQHTDSHFTIFYLRSLTKVLPPRQLDYDLENESPSDLHLYETRPIPIESPPTALGVGSPRQINDTLEHEDLTDNKLPEYRPTEIGLHIPRVHLAAASWSFEEAALELFQNDKITPRNTTKACQLLLCGIQHDLVFKRRVNNSRKRSRPSLRLYDLLAGISVRFRKDEYFQKLLELSSEKEFAITLEPRVEKWQNVTGAWHRRWRNKDKPVYWKGDSGAAVF